jgi:putative membrane protein
MKFLLRWLANAVAFYLALYLVDSLIAPRFWLNAVWLAVILAVLLGLFNSFIKPLYKIRTRPRRALAAAVFTIAMNTLILEIFVLIGAPLSTTSPVWVVAAALFLSLLGGVLNWLIGFKSKQKPGTIAREKRMPPAGGGARERERRTLA